jgi:hypothetical protein
MKVYSYSLESKFCKLLLLFIVFFIIHSNHIQCQTLGFKWSTSLYGSDTDYCFAVVRPAGNYYFILGSTESVDLDYPADSINDERMFLSKINLEGGKEFVRIIDGFPSDSTIHPQRMIATADGSFLAIGYIQKTGPSSNQKDLLLFKLDSSANLLWYKSYGGSGNEEGYDVIETLTGYIATGYSSSSDGDVNHSYGGKDVWIIETDFSGNLGWSRVSGGDENDYAASLLSNGDNVFILGTYGSVETGSLGEDDIILYNITHDGQLLFKNHYGGSNNDRGVKLLLNEYGHLVIAASTSSTNGDIVGNHLYGTLDYALLELDTNYAVINSQCFGSESGEGILDAIIRDDTYYLVGEASSSEGDIGFNYGNSDFWLCAVDSAFNLKGSFVFGGEDSEDWNDDGKSALALSDEGVFFAGSTSSSNGTVFTPIYGATNVYFGDIKFCNDPPQIVTSFPEGDNLNCYGDTVVLTETGCPSCMHIWKDNHSNLDTSASILSGGGFYYYVKVIGECEAVSGYIDILSTTPSYYLKQISYNNPLGGNFKSVAKINDSSVLALAIVAPSGSDLYLALFEHDQLIWDKTYGGSAHEDAEFLLKPESSPNIYFGGATYSTDGDVSFNHGIRDGWIIKADTSGNILKEKTFGGSSYDIIFCMKQLSANRFIACGNTSSTDGDLISGYGNGDTWLTMLDSNLNIIWSKNYGGSSYDQAYDISILNPNSILIYGSTASSDYDIPENKGDVDLWFLMVDSSGAIIWSKTLGTSEYESSRLGSLLTDHNSIFISVTAGGGDGDFPSSYGSTNTWLIKLDTLGNEAWKISLSGSLSDDNSIISFDEDSNIIMVMQSSSNDGLIAMPTDFFSWSYAIFKIDDIGNILSKKFIQGDSYFYDQQSDIWVFDIDTDQENHTHCFRCKVFKCDKQFLDRIHQSKRSANYRHCRRLLHHAQARK